MPANATGAEATPQVRFVERRNPTGGIPQGRWRNVTERWTREFFQNPGKHVEGLLGLDSACLADNPCLGLADELLKKQRAEWNRSGERGKILVCLAYVLGESLRRERPELDWVVVIEAGTAFVDDIGIGRGDAIVDVFSRLSMDKYPLLTKDWFDLATWKRFLLAERPSKIERTTGTLTLSTTP